MSAEPLTREERVAIMESPVRIKCAKHGCIECAEKERWEATVQAEEAGRKAAEERAERLRALASETVEEVMAIGQAWREDWSDFDGRTLRSQLDLATASLREALAADDAARGDL